jgi:hypothetical protein
MNHFIKLIGTICLTILYISLFCNACRKNDNGLSEKRINSEKYRYTITHSFRKVGKGDKVKYIYILLYQDQMITKKYQTTITVVENYLKILLPMSCI